jgi:hypothetical protein
MGQHFPRLLLSTALLTCAATIGTGCATGAKGISQSALTESSVAPQALRAKPSPGTVLAVVRYPAHVDSAAQDAFYKAFSQNAIGGTASGVNAGSPDVKGLADNVILKSNYFALSLYKELAVRLPEHSVLLSPHEIKLGADGSLTSAPMTEAESLPNIVSVDFAAYTFPDPKKMMSKEPLTFGDIVTPLVSVRPDPRASAATQGVLMASAPLVGKAARNGQTAARSELAFLQNGNLQQSIPELDFVSYLTGDANVNVASHSLGKGMIENSVQSYPIEKIRLDRKAISSLDDAAMAKNDPLKKKFSAGFANQIMKMINQTDMEKASMVGRAGAIAQFDESLGALTMIGSTDPDYLARKRYAERLLEAEQKYLSVQSLRLFDGVHNGEMGAQVRDMLHAEYNILQKRRKLAKQKNTALAFAVLSAVAGGAAIVNESKSNNRTSYGETIAIDTLIQGAIFAGQKAYSYGRQSVNIGNNYLSSVIPALNEQVSVQLDLIDSNETITAIRYEDLKEKLQTLYQDKQRSLDTVATRCGYRHNGSSLNGTWLGVCENGVANGTGVGIIQTADGGTLEYYGYAQDGRPQGTGYMIIHSAAGSYSMEGQFSAGNAEGPMKVERPGKASSMRMYRAGNDVGAAKGNFNLNTPFRKPVAR